MAASGFEKMIYRTEQYGVEGDVKQRPVPDQAIEMHACQHGMQAEKQQVCSQHHHEQRGQENPLISRSPITGALRRCHRAIEVGLQRDQA